MDQPQTHDEDEHDGSVAQQLVRGARHRAMRFENEVSSKAGGRGRDEASESVPTVDEAKQRVDRNTKEKPDAHARAGHHAAAVIVRCSLCRRMRPKRC